MPSPLLSCLTPQNCPVQLLFALSTGWSTGQCFHKAHPDFVSLVYKKNVRDMGYQGPTLQKFLLRNDVS